VRDPKATTEKDGDKTTSKGNPGPTVKSRKKTAGGTGAKSTGEEVDREFDTRLRALITNWRQARDSRCPD